MNTNNPNGQRLLVLRELEGLTQGQLAERLHTTQPMISQIEKAERLLTDDLMERTRVEFALPRAFFFIPPTLLDVSLPTFRKNAKVTVGEERRVVRHYREAARCFGEISAASGYHEFMAPASLGACDVEDAASEIRRLAGISPEEPIRNVTRMLERLGVGVIADLTAPSSLPDAKHSGVSVPSGAVTRPLIALASQMPGAVMRFTLAHELAHHIWDRETGGTWRSTRSPEEKRAHAFAGALLLPRSVVEGYVTETLHLSGYLPLKSKYGVSIGASIVRAQRLGLISAERARSLHIQLSARGWRSDEPVEVATERPLLFAQALRKVSDMTVRHVEQITGLPGAMVFTWLGTTPAPEGDVIDLASWRSRAPNRAANASIPVRSTAQP